MDIKIILSKDGSHTLYREDIDETYHSKHGAIQEAQHVFIDMGLKEVERIYNELKRHFKDYNVNSLSGLYGKVDQVSKDPHKDIIDIQRRINEKIMPKYFGKSLTC